MKQRLIIFILTILWLIPSYAQFITGKVIAADDGEPLAGSTVWYKDNDRAKVLVDENGNFKIRYRQGATLLAHSYGFVDKTIVTKSNKPVTFKLESSSSKMSEVTIEAKKKKYTRKGNPAVDIIKKTVEAKKTIDIYNNDYVTFDKYERTLMAIDDIDEATLNDEHLKKTKVTKEFVERCPETGRLILPISVDERKTRELYSKENNKKKTIVEGEAHESLLDLMQIGTNLEAIFKDCLTDVNIYEDHIHMFQHNFLSPIAGGEAISFYHYSLEDTIYVDNDYCFKIQFSPGNVQDFGFSGTLYITADSTWRVRKADIGVPIQGSVNFVKGMTIEQEFSTLPTGEQIRTKNHMMLRLSVASWIKKLYVDYRVKCGGWDFSPIPKKEMNFLADEKYEIGAKHRDAEFWGEARPDTITYAQSHISDMKKKVTDRPVVKALIYGGRIILDNYLETSTDPTKPSKVVIGPFMSTFGSSWIEGFRIRVGAQTMGALSKHWFLKAWGKYGFKDKRWKGFGEVKYSFNEKEKHVDDYPIRTLSFSYTNDIQSPHEKFLEYDKDNIFMTLAWNRNHLQTYYERFHVGVDWEWENGLRIKADFNREWNDATGFRLKDVPLSPDDFGDYMYVPVKYKGTQWIDRVTTTDLTFFINYQPGVKYINTGSKRFLTNKEAPIYGFKHTTGIKGFIGCDYNYNYTEFTFRKRLWLPKAWGNLDFFAQAGIQWNEVPFPLLCQPASNLSFIRSEYSFSLVKNMEFLNDRFASLLIYYDMNGKLFNRVPLLKHLKWREHFGANFYWGYLSDKNNPMKNPDSDILMYFPNVYDGDGNLSYRPQDNIMDTKKPYIEVYAGIHNIFKFFSVDYVHRLTYIHKDTQTWGIRFNFKASF